MWGLSAGTVITKETKEPNNGVLLVALLFGGIVSFVLRYLCLGTYRRNQNVAQNLSDMWIPTFEIGAVQLRSVTEIIAPKSSFLYNYMWTEALSGVVFLPTQELSSSVNTRLWQEPSASIIFGIISH